MRLSQISESLSDWSQRWVHYSDTPHLTIHPRQFHQDPAGLYLFPAEFKPKPSWKRKKYQFFVEVKPDTRVLDLSTVTSSQVDTILSSVSPEVYEQFQGDLDRYPPEDHKELLRRMWQALRHFYIGRPGKFNQMFRSLGYEAIFDDLMVIHVVEVQMLILMPSAIRVIGMDQPKWNAFRGIKKVIDDIADLGENFGSVSVEPPRRRTRWGALSLSGTVRVENSDDNYVSISVSYDYKEPLVRASVEYSMPSLGYGSGASYDLRTGEYEWSGLDSLERSFATIFGERVKAA